MGLGVPLALVALALVGLPILAHLVRRSDVPTRALPTVELLARAIAASRRKVRIVDPLLLVLRVGLVALLVIGASAPFVERDVAYGDGGLASVAIVLDDSMSMSRAGESGATLAEEARQYARAAIDALPDGSEVAIILAGRPARVLVPRTHTRAEGVAAIDELLEPGARATDLEGALTLAARQLSGATRSDRRILVLSDLVRRAGAPALDAPRGVRLDLHALGPASAPNLAVASVDAAPDGTIDGSLSVAIGVRGTRVTTVPITLAVVCAGRELARTTIDLEGGAARATLHVLVPDDSVPACEARLLDAHDALPMDDARAFLLHPSSALRLLLVDGDPRPLSRRGIATGGASTRFFAQALALAPDDGPRVVVRRTDVESFVSGTDAPDVLVLADVDLSRADVARRVDVVTEAGAGLLVAGGEHVHGVESALTSHLPARVTGVSDTRRQGLVVGPLSLRSRDEGLSRVTTTHALTIDAADASQVALRFGDGTPALVLDRGARTAMLALSLDDSGSDLPLHPGFIAMSVELARALAPSGSMPDQPLSPDALPPLTVAAGTNRVDIVSPDGSVVSFDRDLARPIDLGAIVAPGAYTVRSTDASGQHDLARAAFVIASALEESQLDRPTLTSASAAASPSAQGGSRVQARVAPWIFAAAGLVALAEGWARRQRARAAR